MNFSRRELMKTVGAGALARGAGQNMTTASSGGVMGVPPDFSVVRSSSPVLPSTYGSQRPKPIRLVFIPCGLLKSTRSIEHWGR